MRAMQLCQLLWTVHILIHYRGIIPLETVKVLTALAKHGAIKEATITIDVWVAIID